MNTKRIEIEKEVNDLDKKKIFITTKIKKHKNWTKDEDILLLEIADRFKQKSWTKVSTFFIDKNPAQCRARYKRIRPGIIKGAWAKEEDQAIIDFVASNGKNWALISKMMPTRNGKQIRDRFLNYLDPNINRDKFTEEEDKKIIESYIKHGSKWSVIAKNFLGRTGDMIKNRFYSCLKRKIHVYEITHPKRIRKKYYKAKKLRNLKENDNDTAKNPRYRFSIFNSNSHPLNRNELNYNYDHTTKNQHKFDDMTKTAEPKSASPSFNIINNNNNISPSENLRSFNELNSSQSKFYPDMVNSMGSNTHGINLTLENNILNFSSALNNLLNDDQISKLKIAFSNEKENYYSEVLSKNIENLSSFNYYALSKILQLKQQIFQDEKSLNQTDINNRQVLDYLQSINTGNTDCIPFILNYLQSRSKSL